MKSIALVSLFGLAAFLTLMAVSSQLWWDPFTPLLLGLVGIAGPMLIAIAVLEPGFRKLQVEIVALGFASAIFLGVALPGLWFKGEFRIHALAFATPKNIELVLDDPHVPIQEAGCVRAFDLNLSADDIVRLLQQKPQIAAACLARPDVGNIPLRLARQWRLDLNHGASCELASPLTRLESVSVQDRTIELLDCALQAENTEVRTCCAKSLQELNQVKELPGIIMKSSAELHRRSLLDKIVLLSHSETGTLKSYDGSTIRETGMTTPEFQAAALHAGCRAELGESSPGALSSALRWTLDQHIDCINNPAQLEVTPLVVDVCFDYVESEASLDAYCALNRTHRAKRLEAQEMAQQIRPSSDLGDIADTIGSGHARSSNLTFESFLGDVSQSRDGRSLDQYTPEQQAALRRNLEAMRPAIPRPAEVKQDLKGGQDRMNELKKNPELLRLMQTRDPAEIEKVRKRFEEREAKAKRSGKSADTE